MGWFVRGLNDILHKNTVEFRQYAQKYEGFVANIQITGLDWQILEQLQIDGRVSISILAKQLNRSRSSISERIVRLQDGGVIESFSIKVNEEKLGFGLSAFVRIQAESSRHRELFSG